MQAHMNFSQLSMMNRKIMMAQAQQNNLMATNMLMMNIQFNHLLENDEAEAGVSSNSEDLDAEEDDGASTLLVRCC